VGLLEGDSDILIGQLAGEPENGFPTIDFLPFSNAVSFDIHLVESGDEANFLWNPNSEDIDFLLVRTTEETSGTQGSLNITLSTDVYPTSYDLEEMNDPEIIVKGNGNEWPDLTTGTYPSSSISWDFTEYPDSDPERRLLNSFILAGDIDETESGDELGIGITSLNTEGYRYKIIALSGTIDTDNIFTYEDNPFSEILGVWESSSLDGEYHFTKSRNSDEYLYIIIQNWSTSELVLDDEPEAQFISDNFDRWLGPGSGEPQLALIGNPDSILNIGAGLSVILTPFNTGISTDPNALNQYKISELEEGAFSVEVKEYKPNAPPDSDPEENELLFTWDEEDTPSSSSGCSALGLMPGSLLILLPLIILFKKR